jgi:hypothetical protein
MKARIYAVLDHGRFEDAVSRLYDRQKNRNSAPSSQDDWRRSYTTHHLEMVVERDKDVK